MSTSTQMERQTKTTPPSTEDLARLVQEGSDHLAKGELRAALETFEKVIESFPEKPEGHNNLGAMYSSLGDWAKAEECFTSVLGILPHNANCLYNRGVVRAKLEQIDGAREDFESALKIIPNDPDVLNNLGVIAFMQGRHKPARKIFRKAAKIDPLNANAVINLCDVEVADGNLTTAVTLCEEYLSRHNHLEIRQRHLDLLSLECRNSLEKASLAAKELLQSDEKNSQVMEELTKLKQAHTLLTGSNS